MSRYTEMMKKIKEGKNKTEVDKTYMRNVKKSVKELSSDVYKEVGYPISKVKSFFNFFREMRRDDRKGVTKRFVKDAIKGSEFYVQSKGYAKSVKKALKTGKLYRNEDEAFEAMFNSYGGDDGFDYNPEAYVKDDNGGDLTSGDMVVNDSVNNQTAEIKLALSRNTLTIDNNFKETNTTLKSIFEYFDKTHREHLTKSMENQKTAITLLAEIRDLTKKGIETDQLMAESQAIKEMTAIDKLLKGDFMGAVKHSASNIIREYDRYGFMSMMPMANQMLMSARENPFGFIKDKMIDKIPFLKELKKNSDPAKIADTIAMMGMASNNKHVSKISSIIRGRKDSNELSVNTGDYVKGKINLDGYMRKSVIEVMPTYLRQIVSLLSGREEEVYNYETGRFQKVSSMKSIATQMMKKSFSSKWNFADMGTEWARKAGVDISFSQMKSATDQMLVDMAMSNVTSLDALINHWNYDTFKKFVKTDIDKTTYNVIRAALLANKNTETGRQTIDVANGDLENFVSNKRSSLDQLKKAGESHGYNALFNGSLDQENIIANFMSGGKRRGRRRRKKESWDFKELLKHQKVDGYSNITLDGLATSDIDNFNKSMDDKGTIDTLYATTREVAKTYVKTFKKKWNNSSDATKAFMRSRLGDDRINRLLSMNINDEDDVFELNTLINPSSMSGADNIKSMLYTQKIESQRNLMSGMKSYQKMFDYLGNDKSDEGDEAMGKTVSSILKTGLKGASLAAIPALVSSKIGFGFPIAIAAAAMGYKMLNNDKDKELLEKGILTQEEYDAKRKFRGTKVSQLFTGLGVSGATALIAGPLMFKWFGPLAPLAIAATGIGAAVASEKDTVKKMLFGDKYDKEKSFMQHAKEALLGDGNTDDGIIGKWANPMIKRVKSGFESMNKNLDEKIFSPIKNKFLNIIDTLDGTKFGKKFEDIMGVGLKNFVTSMNKSIFAPLGRGIFKMLGKGLGFLNPKLGALFSGTKAPAKLSPDHVTETTESGGATIRNQRAKPKTKKAKNAEKAKEYFSKETIDSDYVSQNDPAIKNLKVAGHKVDDYGCAIAVGMMLVNRLSKTTANISDIMDLASPHMNKNGIHYKFFEDLSNKYGIPRYTVDREYLKNPENIMDVLDNFKDGSLYVALIRTSKKTNHFILIKGLEKDTIVYDDPENGPNKRMNIDELTGIIVHLIRFAKKVGFFKGLFRRLFRAIFRGTRQRAREKMGDIKKASEEKVEAKPVESDNTGEPLSESGGAVASRNVKKNFDMKQLILENRTNTKTITKYIKRALFNVAYNMESLNKSFKYVFAPLLTGFKMTGVFKEDHTDKLIRKESRIRNFFGGIGNAIASPFRKAKDKYDEFKEWTGKKWENIKKRTGNAWTATKGFAIRKGTDLLTYLTELPARMVSGISRIASAFTTTMTHIGGWVTSPFRWLWRSGGVAIPRFFNGLWNGIQGLGRGAGRAAGSLWSGLERVGGSTLTGISRVGGALFDGGVAVTKGAWNASSAVVKGTYGAGRTLVSDLYGGGKRLIGDIYGGISGGIKKLSDKAFKKKPEFTFVRVVGGYLDGVQFVGKNDDMRHYKMMRKMVMENYRNSTGDKIPENKVEEKKEEKSSKWEAIKQWFKNRGKNIKNAGLWIKNKSVSAFNYMKGKFKGDDIELPDGMSIDDLKEAYGMNKDFDKTIKAYAKAHAKANKMNAKYDKQTMKAINRSYSERDKEQAREQKKYEKLMNKAYKMNSKYDKKQAKERAKQNKQGKRSLFSKMKNGAYSLLFGYNNLLMGMGYGSRTPLDTSGFTMEEILDDPVVAEQVAEQTQANQPSGNKSNYKSRSNPGQLVPVQSTGDKIKASLKETFSAENVKFTAGNLMRRMLGLQEKVKEIPLYKDRARHIFIAGGHLDSVGAIGAVDRDALMETVSYLRAKTGNGDIGFMASRNSQILKDIDEEQDTARAVENEQTSWLSKIAGKTMNTLGITKENSKGIKGKLGIILSGIGAIAALVPLLTKLVSYKFFGSKKFKDTVGRGQQKVFGINDYEAEVSANSTSKNFKRASIISTGNTLNKMAYNRKMWGTVGTNGVIGKTVGKSWNRVAVARNGVANLAGNAIKNVDNGGFIKSIANSATKLLTKLFTNKVLLKVLPFRLVMIFVDTIPNLVDKIIKKVGAKIGPSLMKAVGKYAAPLMVVYDIIKGWNNAHEFFEISPEMVTPAMRLTATLVNALQGILPMIWLPLIIFTLIPSTWLTQFLYKLFANEDAEKDLEKAKEETEERYQKVKEAANRAGDKEISKSEYLKNAAKYNKKYQIKSNDVTTRDATKNHSISMSKNGDGATSTEIGCGPFAVYHALSKAGVSITLESVMKEMNSLRQPGVGFTQSQIINYINKYNVSAGSTSKEQLKAHLEGGGAGIVLLSGKDHWVYLHSYEVDTHYIFITDNASNRVYGTLSTILNESSNFILIGGKIVSVFHDNKSSDTTGEGFMKRQKNTIDTLNKKLAESQARNAMRRKNIYDASNKANTNNMTGNSVESLLVQNNQLLSGILAILTQMANKPTEISKLGDMIKSSFTNASKTDDTWLNHVKNLVKS